MKKMVKVWVVLLAVFFLFGTVTVPAFAENLKVGVLLPLTGKLAKFGEIENKSFKMAAKEINAAGGVNGKKVELIIEGKAPACGYLGRSVEFA